MRYLLEAEREMCIEPPIGCSTSGTFLVDLSKLDHRDDIRADDLGVWINKGVKTSHCIVRFCGENVRSVTVLDCKPTIRSSLSYRLKRTYWVHSEDKEVRHRLFELEGTVILCGCAFSQLVKCVKSMYLSIDMC